MYNLTGRFNLSDSVRMEVSIKNLNDDFANASNIYYRVEDYDGNTIMNDTIPINYSTGMYRGDIYLGNNSFSEGAYLFGCHGDIAGFYFTDYSYFEVKRR